jgi:formylglycine-generating enzyme required for sulfatase activity
MVYVPGGTFMMGSNNAGFPNEGPIHQQTVSALYVDITKVTAASYSQCVSSGKCTNTAITGPNCNYGISGKETHPINCTDWNQADRYCASYGKRLLSEIEFEYITRGSVGAEYSWGNNAPSSQLCWNNAETCAVDSFPRTIFGAPNPQGLSDLAGNLLEFTSSFYCDYPLTIPGGINCLTNKSVRSSSYSSTKTNEIRAAFRSSTPVSTNSYGVGFRCAKSIN